MANIKISELNELSVGADNDYLPIVDSSESETKKISLENLKEYNNNGVIESGSNENGEWIKFENGTLICMGKINISYPVLNTWYDETANFPNQFIDTPYVTLGLNEQHRRINTTYRTQNNSQIIIGFISQDGAGGSSNVSYVAIGKWK